MVARPAEITIPRERNSLLDSPHAEASSEEHGISNPLPKAHQHHSLTRRQAKLYASVGKHYTYKGLKEGQRQCLGVWCARTLSLMSDYLTKPTTSLAEEYRSDAAQTKEATGTDDQLGGNDAASETQE